tara:strand:- start:33 stop:311 length:279 start_codon:yes stop_codon:yes gene_type:complete
MNDNAFHEQMQEAYFIQEKDRESFQEWAIQASKELKQLDRKDDPNHNDYYVAVKLPPSQYQRFYTFCKSNDWSKSTALKFAIHQLLSSKQNG